MDEPVRAGLMEQLQWFRTGMVRISLVIRTMCFVTDSFVGHQRLCGFTSVHIRRSCTRLLSTLRNLSRALFPCNPAIIQPAYDSRSYSFVSTQHTHHAAVYPRLRLHRLLLRLRSSGVALYICGYPEPHTLVPFFYRRYRVFFAFNAAF